MQSDTASLYHLFGDTNHSWHIDINEKEDEDEEILFFPQEILSQKCASYMILLCTV